MSSINFKLTIEYMLFLIRQSKVVTHQTCFYFFQYKVPDRALELRAMRVLFQKLKADAGNMDLKREAVRYFLRHHRKILEQAGLFDHDFIKYQYRGGVRSKMSNALATNGLCEVGSTISLKDDECLVLWQNINKILMQI